MARFDNGYHDFIAAHNEQLTTVSREHATYMGSLARNHIETMGHAPVGFDEFRMVCDVTTRGVQTYSRATAQRVAMVLDKSRKAFESLAAGTAEHDAFCIALSDFNVYRDATYVMRQHTSGLGRQALLVAFDSLQFEEAKQTMHIFGNAKYVMNRKVNDKVSGKPAESAMYAGLDHQSLDHAQANARIHGSGYAMRSKTHASSNDARRGIFAALDGITLQRALKNYRVHKNPDYVIRRSVDGEVSTGDVATLFARLVGGGGFGA